MESRPSATRHGDLAETAAWAGAVAAGRLSGPTIFQVGPMLNGKSFNRYQYALGSAEETRGTIRSLKSEGVDGLEIERRVPRDVYFALMAEAKALTSRWVARYPSMSIPRKPLARGRRRLTTWRRFLISDYGTVESGKIADLLLLDADPTRASFALHRIDHVILHGKPLDKAALTALLQKAQAAAENN